MPQDVLLLLGVRLYYLPKLHDGHGKTDRGDCFDDDPEPGIHTNEWNNCPRPCDGYTDDASDAVVDKVKAWLAHSAASQPHRWINLQGPGIDDAYRFRREGVSGGQPQDRNCRSGVVSIDLSSTEPL